MQFDRNGPSDLLKFPGEHFHEFYAIQRGTDTSHHGSPENPAGEGTGQEVEPAVWVYATSSRTDPFNPAPIKPVKWQPPVAEPAGVWDAFVGGLGYGAVEVTNAAVANREGVPYEYDEYLEWAVNPGGKAAEKGVENAVKGLVDILIVDVPTVYRNSRAGGHGRLGSGYNAVGTAIATLTGVRGISDARYEHDAVDAHQQSLFERAFDGVSGAVSLVATAAFIGGAAKSLGSGGAKVNPAAPRAGEVPRPSVNTSLPRRVTDELPAGQLRTAAEVKQARNFFERNRDAAEGWWSRRNGGKPWPKDATHFEHPRAIADGGDPLFVDPGYGGANARHMIPGPDGLTDFQRWGRRGGRPPSN